MLALDGGGIRGVVSLEFLARVQTLLRQRHGDPDLRLADYFDLIGGTSTGAIIAAALATGMDVDEVRELYRNVGGRVFGRKRFLVYRSAFDSRPLEYGLREAFGELQLGSPEIKTGLCIVTKRADTRGTWPLLNHPRGTFYERNRHILVRHAVRASAAAPGFFEPQKVEVGDGEWGLFVDGGVSMMNNPALELFFIATLRGFPFHWSTGDDRLLLLSVGTGTWRQRTAPKVMANYRLWNWASEVPAMLMQDASLLGQSVLQCLSRSPTAMMIDSEMGDLAEDLWTREPALHYLRYNVRLEEETLRDLGLHQLISKVAQLRRLDAVRVQTDLETVGARAAERLVTDDHFPAAFDIPVASAQRSGTPHATQ
jgi:hypothetical protein